MKTFPKIFLAIFAFFFLANASAVFALDPTVVSFAANPNSLGSGQIVQLTWNVQSSGGQYINIACPAGVTLTDSNNQNYSCNTKVDVSSIGSEGLSLIVYNWTGTSQYVTSYLTPKNVNGAEAPASAKDTSFLVFPTSAIIADFSASATTTLPNTNVTLNWTARNPAGVNLQIECNDFIKVYSASYNSGNAPIPCAQPIFSANLPSISSAVLSFQNSSPSDVNYGIHLLPAISANLYNGLADKKILIDILPKAAEIISVDYFKASISRADTGAPFGLTWKANSAGAEIKAVFNSDMPFSYSQGTTTFQNTPNNFGGNFAFSANVLPVGSASMTFTNNSTEVRTVNLYLTPQKIDGTFDGTKLKTIQLQVFPYQAPSQTPNGGLLQTGSLASSTAPPNSASAKKPIFTKPLKLGARNADVSLLQTFLKKDKTIYPEGLVTGYFGAATQKAVQKFQMKYNLAKLGDTGYGFVGDATRAKLNSLQ